MSGNQPRAKLSKSSIKQNRTISAENIYAKSYNNNSRKIEQTRFITSGKPTLFKSVLSQRPRSVQTNKTNELFGYDLSPDELKFTRNPTSPMKAVSENEKQLLREGERLSYLSRRYEYAPDHKYNYPEATSWRIGWQHNQTTPANTAFRY